MAAKHIAGIVISFGLALSWSGARAADPQPQYTVQDVAKAFAEKPAAEPGDADEAAPPAGACEAKGMVTGPDGLCYKANNATAGFNLGRKATARPTPAAAPIVRRVKANPAQQVASAGGQKDLQITFMVGSADLTEQGRANASVFAKALSLVPQLTGARFQLAGYTDASGDKDKNLALSQRRADAVKAFLVQQGVDGGRLTAQGYGAQNFLPGAPSTAPQNRRVVAIKE
jgi:outer membrane protein OmpA-like peptidoglycan-associated protein